MFFKLETFYAFFVYFEVCVAILRRASRKIVEFFIKYVEKTSLFIDVKFVFNEKKLVSKHMSYIASNY